MFPREWDRILEKKKIPMRRVDVEEGESGLIGKIVTMSGIALRATQIMTRLISGE